jgi:hypothetical protein
MAEHAQVGEKEVDSLTQYQRELLCTSDKEDVVDVR